MEWVQCDKCENWYHCNCVGISAQDANNIDEYVCPYCTTPATTPVSTVAPEKIPDDKTTTNSTTPSSSSTPVASKIPDLSVIAEVAHQIITDQVKASDKRTTDAVNDGKPTPDVTMTTPQQQPEPSAMDFNSLICLADVSEKMDVS